MSGLFQQGARFSLKRVGLTAELASYRASIELPSGDAFVREVVFRRDGQGADPAETPFVFVAAEGGAVAGSPDRDAALEPEAWMVSFIATLTKQVSRAGLKTQDWPRKLRRWKGNTE